MKANLLRELHGWDAFARSATTDGDQVDPVGLSIDIEHALWETDNFREASQRIDGDVICVEVEWRGSDSALEDVYRDFTMSTGASRREYSLSVAVLSPAQSSFT